MAARSGIGSASCTFVVNYLRLRDPVADATMQAAQEDVQLVVDAGAHSPLTSRRSMSPT
jgi:hypothetical protein